MKKTLALLVMLALYVPVMACIPLRERQARSYESDNPVGKEGWPKKKSTIYISFPIPSIHQYEQPDWSATFIGAVLGSALDTSAPAPPIDRLSCDKTPHFCWYYTPACEALNAWHVKRRKQQITAHDSFNMNFLLIGDFRPWIHYSPDACRAAVDSLRPPRLRMVDSFLTILPEDAPEEPMTVTVTGPGFFTPAGLVQVNATPPPSPFED